MDFELRHKNNPDKTLPLTADRLADLALRFHGDNGYTERGTARAMLWLSAVNAMRAGEVTRLGKAIGYEIVAVAA